MRLEIELNDRQKGDTLAVKMIEMVDDKVSHEEEVGWKFMLQQSPHLWPAQRDGCCTAVIIATQDCIEILL
jgi:hypothetical protein